MPLTAMPLIALLLMAWCGAALAWPLARLPHRLWRYLPAALPLTLFIGFMLHARSVAAGVPLTQTLQWVPSLGVALSLRLDGFSLLFSLLITGIGTLVATYATAYFCAAPPRERARFICLILAFMGAMLGTVLSDNLIVMFVFWEATSLLSFLLIGFEGHRVQARKAALQSLLVTGAGGLALFGGILLIGMVMASFSLADITARRAELAASPWLIPAMILVMVGAFTKSAQFPFHFWLPQAMAAPTPASAYLHSATMVKLGVYLLARFDPVMADVRWYGDTLVIVGMLTMLFAALHAVRATGYKAVLAQSTVATLGILVMLIGLDRPTASVALCAFIVAHAFYKAALFFCAGTVIHVAHVSEWRGLGGMARTLPHTALAAILASLSMAGLPPFIGFIAKEYLFEAQLNSAWHALPVVVAIVVNATLVAIAAIVTLKPFFARRTATHEHRHAEPFGLTIGPLTLGLLGLAAGIFPNVVARYLVVPAASALHGTTLDLTFSLWHGLTPMLALSAVVVTLGALLAWRWDAAHDRLAAAAALSRIDANRHYQMIVDGILALARRCTDALQNGDSRRYMLVTCLTLVSTMLYAVGDLDVWVAIRPDGALRVVPTALLMFAIVGACVAARTRSPLVGLIGVGVVGYGSALFFLFHGAPDLALTQFAVETLILIVLMAVLVRLPGQADATRTVRERRVDGAVAAVFGATLFIALVSMLAWPLDARLSEFFAATSFLQAHGRNVVNVIIVDYRALDTLGEIAVVGFATLAVWVLLRQQPSRRAGPRHAPAKQERPS